MAMQLSEQLQILKRQGNQRGGSRKVYLQMQRTIYGSIQTARAFWMELQKAFRAMGYTRSTAVPCLYFRWDEDGELCVGLTWINDCIIVGSSQVVDRERQKMMQLFECDDVGPMEEYVGNKIEMSEQRMKLTQPVLLQSFADEFGVKSSGESLLAKPGQILSKGKEKDMLGHEAQKKY
jgi:Reverse transcriptase (RNA-dependent DNA polymerase)